jgi:hypothetical protein
VADASSATRLSALRAGTGRAEAAVFAVALLVRLAVRLSSGGLTALSTYDPGVYYAAGDALTFGRLPYRDFVFLHPPAVIVVLAPFDWFGRLTSDLAGFVAANLAFALLGALNAVLVVRLARHLGLGTRAAVAGGLTYALWFGSVGAEYGVRLEPLGNLFALLGLLAFARARATGARRPALWCGAAFGAASAVKIWWVVPLVVMLGWLLAGRRSRQVGAFLAGAAAALVVICVPFFLAAPRQMFDMVITEQLGRNITGAPLVRLAELSTLRPAISHPSQALTVVWLVGVAAVLVVVCRFALREAAARPFLVLAGAQLLVLLAAPGWFGFYADYLAPALAITIAAAVAGYRHGGAQPAASRRRLLPVLLAPLVIVALTTGAALVQATRADQHAFPGQRLARALGGRGCVMSDAPGALIGLRVLSRDLGYGCANWIDVSGRTYGADRAGRNVPRRANARWQRDLLAYFRSGQAIILVRAHATGVAPGTMRVIRAGGVLARDGGYVIWRVRR